MQIITEISLTEILLWHNYLTDLSNLSVKYTIVQIATVIRIISKRNGTRMMTLSIVGVNLSSSGAKRKGKKLYIDNDENFI